jgi:uncharacterized membrane protein YfcA
VSAAEALGLLLAGVASGLCGSIAGLASLFSYPALLAAGLAPVAANVTNTVSLVFSTVGSVSASRPELRGQRHRARQLGAAGVIGGVLGALLLLVTPAESFERLVPWLIGLASVAILVRRQLEEVSMTDAIHQADWRVVLGVGAVGVYGGYFGAGAGVMLLSLLLFATGDTLPRANAMKNLVLGLANGVAAVTFALFGPVDWTVVVPLGLGLLIGGRLGPVIVRRAPPTPLRVVIAVLGLGLAVKLAMDAYG